MQLKKLASLLTMILMSSTLAARLFWPIKLLKRQASLRVLISSMMRMRLHQSKRSQGPLWLIEKLMPMMTIGSMTNQISMNSSLKRLRPSRPIRRRYRKRVRVSLQSITNRALSNNTLKLSWMKMLGFSMKNLALKTSPSQSQNMSKSMEVNR